MARVARVVRAGEAKAIDLLKGYREHLGVPVSRAFRFTIRRVYPGKSWRVRASIPMHRSASPKKRICA
jgi:hypothetical protein